MRLNWTNAVAEQEDLRERWDALVLQMEQPQVFYTWEWAAAFARAYQGSVEPWIATAYEGDELVGVAALARSGNDTATFLAGTTADYCDFVSRPERQREFVAQVLQAVQDAGVRKLVLANLPSDSATVGELENNRAFKSFLRTGYLCAQVRLGSPDDRKALAEAMLKKKMLRRSLNALRGSGPVNLQHELGDGLKRDTIDSFCRTHVARFLATGRISNLVSAQRREFLRELAGLLSRQGWFDLTTLRAGTRVLAQNYGFRFQGSWFWYQPTIVNEFEDHSPGYCLLAKMVEDAANHPEVGLVDLGLGAEGYKERFANAQRKTLHVTLTRDRSAMWSVRTRYRVAEAIKKAVRVETVARRMQRLAQSGRRRVEQGGWAHFFAATGRRLRRFLASKDEVVLFHWPGVDDESEARVRIEPINWEILADAAIRYDEDRETLDYLLRSAARFRADQMRGFALMGIDGTPEHFAWTAPYEGFAMEELGEILHAPSENSVLIIDCWTPRELRGHGLYARAIRDLAGRLWQEGKQVWIFSAAGNVPSISGIRKAGFQTQALLAKHKILLWSKTSRQERQELPTDTVDVLSNPAMR